MKTQQKKRVHFIDTLRGFLIIYVVYYHLMYDLNDILGYNIPYLYSDWFASIRDGMSGTLIFISGISCNFSGNNIKRGIKTLLIALALTLVTFFIMPSQIILFGILHLLGSMMLIYSVIELVKNKVMGKGSNLKIENTFSELKFAKRILIMCILMFLFVMSFNVYYGYIQVFGNYVELPDFLYGSFPTYLLGFRADYFSADYYPMIPWGLLFLAGAMFGYCFKSDKIPDFMYKNKLPWLSFIGRHTMIIYIVHQPLLFGIFYIISNYSAIHHI